MFVGEECINGDVQILMFVFCLVFSKRKFMFCIFLKMGLVFVWMFNVFVSSDGEIFSEFFEFYEYNFIF